MKVLKTIGIVLLVIIGLIPTFTTVKRFTPLAWSSKEVNQPLFSSLAINGYDVVAYFTQSKAIEGKEEYAYEWSETKWIFSSEDNKKLFVASPEKYVPEYGGYCAFVVSNGFTANTDTNSFEIIDSKLYLFADDEMKANWKNEQNENMNKSNANWE